MQIPLTSFHNPLSPLSWVQSQGLMEFISPRCGRGLTLWFWLPFCLKAKLKRQSPVTSNRRHSNSLVPRAQGGHCSEHFQKPAPLIFAGGCSPWLLAPLWVVPCHQKKCLQLGDLTSLLLACSSLGYKGFLGFSCQLHPSSSKLLCFKGEILFQTLWVSYGGY